MVTSFSENSAYKTCIENEDSLKIYSDVASEKGGQSDGFRPHDLLCASFAACLNITVRMLLDKEKLSYDAVKVNVELNRNNPNKTIFTYDVEIAGNIGKDVKQAIIEKASNCPVHRTLSKSIVFEKQR